MAIGPYQGEESGETALFRTLFASLAAGDIAVMDRYCSSCLMIGLLAAQFTHT